MTKLDRVHVFNERLLVLLLGYNNQDCLELFAWLFSTDLPTIVGGGEKGKEKDHHLCPVSSQSLVLTFVRR